jgi:hypothetical protein
LSRLRKNEREVLAELLEQGADTPETLAQLVADKLDELRGERTGHYACMIVAGIPVAVGPFATDNQAQKAAEKAALADKTWIVDGWTPEGWANHLTELDKAPERSALNKKEEAARAKAFWGRVSRIKDGEATAITGNVTVKPLKLPKGCWG